MFGSSASASQQARGARTNVAALREAVLTVASLLLTLPVYPAHSSFMLKDMPRPSTVQAERHVL